MKSSRLSLILFLSFLFSAGHAQITLIGDNPPHANVNDGDFNTVRTYWRTGKMSPFWTAVKKDAGQDATMGIHSGQMYSSSDFAIAESHLLNNTAYKSMKVGDRLSWRFAADLEYVCQGTLSFALVFGEQERMLAERVKLYGSDKKEEQFQGIYVLNPEDVAGGFPRLRVYFYSERGVKVWLNDVTVQVLTEDNAGPSSLQAVASDGQVLLTWVADAGAEYNIYRKGKIEKTYRKLAVVRDERYIDKTSVNGMEYDYLLTVNGAEESAASNIVCCRYLDRIAPEAPQHLETENNDTEIRLRWHKSPSKDVASYALYRKDGHDYSLVAKGIKKNTYFDYTVTKGVENSYQVYAEDYSGNRSEASLPAIAKTKMVEGSSFRDLILPLPIQQALTVDTWGADGVLPRDVSNGVEDDTWSYWGGKPMKGKDGKYHMHVVRWAEGGMKGHWEWPNSQVVHSISDTPIGPYIPTGLSYDFADGFGHNADVTQLNDGRYLLYSLIHWEPTLFVSDAMAGPWERLGVMDIDFDTAYWNDQRVYQVERNLSGVQLPDGSILFVTKTGRMMKSDGALLGPYKVLTDKIQNNTSIPDFYRHSNYEDPCLWYDGIQFHCLINAFFDKRAIYLRSADGIDWVCDPGVAYDPAVTRYEDGTRTHWYKLERPHVLQDDYGRATHLSLAVMDVPKAEDLSKDKHSSKNLIVPLRKHRLLTLLSQKNDHYRVLIKAEDDFNPHQDIDLNSICFGAAQEVDYGRGAKVFKTKKRGADLILYFAGEPGLKQEDFVAKLLGRTKKGALILGFVKL